MKRLSLLFVLGVLLFAIPARADFNGGNWQGCDDHRDRDNGCYQHPTNVPEPGSLAQLAVGLASVGGLAVAFGRKRFSKN
jgi:hypothetical protein